MLLRNPASEVEFQACISGTQQPPTKAWGVGKVPEVGWSALTLGLCVQWHFSELGRGAQGPQSHWAMLI